MGTAVVPLGEYRIPNEIRYNVNSGDGSVSGKLKDSLEVPVQGPGEYREKFHALLYLEELQMEVDIRRYDMEDAEMKKERNLLSLEVGFYLSYFSRLKQSFICLLAPQDGSNYAKNSSA